MNTKDLKNARKGEENNVIDFSTPLKVDPTPPELDWLRTLPHEARFIAKPVNYRGPWLNQFGIGMILPQAILLAMFDDGHLAWKWVDSRAFSRENVWVANIPVMKEPEQPAGVEDG